MNRSEDFEELIEQVRALLHLPDPSPFEMVLAAYVAHRLDGDPVWLMLIGGPSSGKNELLDLLAEMPKIEYMATVTEAGLLSGTKEAEREPNATGGVLPKLGKSGIIIPRDFTSVLSMGRDAQMRIFAALREAHSGSLSRHLGTGGGQTFEWKGKLGFIGGVTGEIDSHQEVINKMGPRFCFFRLPEVDPEEQARQAMKHGGKENKLRSQLKTNVSQFLFRLFPVIESRNKNGQLLPARVETWLVPLSAFVCVSRSSVVRESYSHDVIHVHAAESPARLIKELAKYHTALSIIGDSPARAKQLVIKTAMDSLPPIRRKVLEQLIKAREKMKSFQIAEAVSMPETTVKRALEDLRCHGLIEWVSGAGLWGLTHFWRSKCDVVFPKS